MIRFGAKFRNFCKHVKENIDQWVNIFLMHIDPETNYNPNQSKVGTGRIFGHTL